MKTVELREKRKRRKEELEVVFMCNHALSPCTNLGGRKLDVYVPAHLVASHCVSHC